MRVIAVLQEGEKNLLDALVQTLPEHLQIVAYASGVAENLYTQKTKIQVSCGKKILAVFPYVIGIEAQFFEGIFTILRKFYKN